MSKGYTKKAGTFEEKDYDLVKQLLDHGLSRRIVNEATGWAISTCVRVDNAPTYDAYRAAVKEQTDRLQGMNATKRLASGRLVSPANEKEQSALTQSMGVNPQVELLEKILATLIELRDLVGEQVHGADEADRDKVKSWKSIFN